MAACGSRIFQRGLARAPRRHAHTVKCSAIALTLLQLLVLLTVHVAPQEATDAIPAGDSLPTQRQQAAHEEGEEAVQPRSSAQWASTNLNDGQNEYRDNGETASDALTQGRKSETQ
eukprot:GHVT01035022.1.p1 GENE.GHVT01035022.1~~GHVT01035022.1.p1  ORF type:complete len:116 (+),score=29.89 GHVT01035022.1:1790-2137(+)